LLRFLDHIHLDTDTLSRTPRTSDQLVTEASTYTTHKQHKVSFRTAEAVSVVSDGEVLFIFVTVEGESILRNISARHKIL
jgi:uncharacterized DUF497 family protein